jgi:hypothetical protein
MVKGSLVKPGFWRFVHGFLPVGAMLFVGPDEAAI